MKIKCPLTKKESYIRVGIFFQDFSLGFEYSTREFFNPEYTVIDIEDDDTIAVLDRKGNSRKLFLNFKRNK